MINSKEQISKHFHGDEFACPCCGVVQIDEELLSALESIHLILDCPVHILSGYRCEEHNKAVGGEPYSQHCLGKAADVRILSEISLRTFYKTADELKRFGGIGLYPAGAGQIRGFLHLDVRKKTVRWSRLFGEYLSLKEGLDFIASSDGKH